MSNLSKNFTLAELTISQEATRSGLKNTPNSEQIECLIALCENVLQPLRDRLRRPIVVSSGYRSLTINCRIGGSAKSQHCKGQAADFTVPGMTVAEVVALIRKMGLPVDQCIAEFGQWVHVSHRLKGPQRGQYLVATFRNGKTEYKVIP